MTTVEAIETQVKHLSLPQLKQFRNWFADWDANAWDEQIEADAQAGKLDAIAEEALSEYNAGKAKEI
jgi:hypothetical protein